MERAVPSTSVLSLPLQDDFLLIHYDKGPGRNKLGHSRASVIWHRTQVGGGTPGVLISGTETHRERERERERNRTCVCHFQKTCQLDKDLPYRKTASKCSSCQSFSWTEIMLLVGLSNMNGGGGGLVAKSCPPLAIYGL